MKKEYKERAKSSFKELMRVFKKARKGAPDDDMTKPFKIYLYKENHNFNEPTEIVIEICSHNTIDPRYGFGDKYYEEQGFYPHWAIFLNPDGTWTIS